jgi:hypothetical protein
VPIWVSEMKTGVFLFFAAAIAARTTIDAMQQNFGRATRCTMLLVNAGRLKRVRVSAW